MRRLNRMLAIVVAGSGLCVYADELIAQPPAPATESTSSAAAPQTAEAETPKLDTIQSELPKAQSSRPQTLDDGRVILNFRDEDWLPALDWLAKQLKLNLDFQAMPDGKLNLFSSNPYALEEAEDLINMQLLGRGFTLLKRAEVLRLVPMKEIDITLVPRVAPEELEGLQKHQVVRVSIALDWMVAEQAAKEFKPLLSPHGQIVPLVSSNRLEVLDAVVNLRELVRLITRAESDDGRRIRVQEFPLKYRKAQEVAIQVRQLLGLPPDGTPAPSSLTQLEIEQARFRAEAVKQLGNNARDLLGDKKPDTFLVVNEKENSIVVNAPPDKLEMVRQTVETLDKPLPEADSSWQTVSRVKVHPVNGFDPEAISRLLLALQERGNLAKDTRIQHEAAYNRIIAFASPEDHLTISQLIESYRAEKRSAAVIPLSNVTPSYAVKAIQLILKSPERPSTMPGVPSDGKFQIEADPDNHRLLVWATSDELKEVRDFLTNLGETFEAKTDEKAQMHVVSVATGDVAEVTQRLQEVWQEVSDAPLVIERKPATSTTLPAPPGLSPDDASAKPVPAAAGDGEANNGAMDSKLRLVSSSRVVTAVNASNSDAAAPALANDKGLPPVRIIEGKKGDLVIISRDAQAAGTAKKLLQQLVPDPGDVRVVRLKYAQAINVRRQLEEMIGATAAAVPPSSKLASPEPPVRIEADSRTNRLIIQHCTARQLELINQYIPVLDQAPAEQDRMTRQQRVYRVKHRRASEVLEVVKEVYRDLLSGNDRAFSSYSNYRPYGYNKNLAATSNNPEYQGLMAVGADAEANSLVISAPGYLIDEVIKLAESVDSPADGPAVAVVPAAGDASDVKLREALSKILRKR